MLRRIPGRWQGSSVLKGLRGGTDIRRGSHRHHVCDDECREAAGTLHQVRSCDCHGMFALSRTDTRIPSWRPQQRTDRPAVILSQVRKAVPVG